MEQQPVVQDPPSSRKKLYTALNKEGKYTKSYQEFEKQFSNPESAANLHKALETEKLYTKDYASFQDQFFGDLYKKKVDTQPGSQPVEQNSQVSGDGLTPRFDLDQFADNRVGQDYTPQTNLPVLEEFPEAHAEMGAERVVNRIDRQQRPERFMQKEIVPDMTMRKSMWNFLSNQLPSALASFGAAVTPNHPMVMAPIEFTDKQREEFKQGQKQTQTALLEWADKKSQEGAKINQSLTDRISEVTDPLDAMNWLSSTMGQASVQIPLAIASGGTSSIAQETGSIYLESVKKIAAEKGIGIQEVIEQGLDSPAAALAWGTAAGILDYVGAKGALGSGKKALADGLRARTLEMIKAGAVEGGTEYTQTFFEQIGTDQAAGKEFQKAFEGAFTSAKAQERLEALAAGLVSGTAMSGGMAERNVNTPAGDLGTQSTEEEQNLKSATDPRSKKAPDVTDTNVGDIPEPVVNQEDNLGNAENAATITAEGAENIVPPTIEETVADSAPGEETGDAVSVQNLQEPVVDNNVTIPEEKVTNVSEDIAIRETRNENVIMASPSDVKAKFGKSFGNKPFKYYREQFIPINFQTGGQREHWTSDRDIVLNEGPNGYKYDIAKGDKLYLSVDSPANGDADSATSYKLVNITKGKHYPILNLIPDSIEGGELNDSDHYDAVTQIKNLESVLSGQAETAMQSKDRKVKILAEQIPDMDFYVSKPRNSDTSFESPQLVQFKNGKYRRLRGDSYMSADALNKVMDTKSYKPSDEEAFNVWGEYDSKEDIAWDIYHNARLITKDKPTSKTKLNDEWSKQFNFLRDENKRRYKSGPTIPSETERQADIGTATERSIPEAEQEVPVGSGVDQTNNQGVNQIQDGEQDNNITLEQPGRVSGGQGGEIDGGTSQIDSPESGSNDKEQAGVSQTPVSNAQGSEVEFDWLGRTRKGLVLRIEGDKVKIKADDGAVITKKLSEVKMPEAMKTEAQTRANQYTTSVKELSGKLDAVVKKTKQSTVPKTSGQANIKLNPFYYLDQVDKTLMEKILNVRKIEDYISRVSAKGQQHSNFAVRNAAGVLQNIIGGLSYTHGDLKNKLEYTGNKNYAAVYAKSLANDLYKVIDSDHVSLERVHFALDPEIATTPVDYNDLNDQEKNLYDLLRTTNDFIHEWNFGQGLISKETYDEHKGKYIARLYEQFELVPPDVKEEFNKSRADFAMFKERKNAEDVDLEILKDPVYATVKRIAQMMRNQAIFEYADAINASGITVSNTPFPNSTQLGKPGDKPFYGSLTGKFVPNYIAQDFKGFYFANEALQHLYSAFKGYDKNIARQVLKKSKTVYNPLVQLGNFLSNYSFAYWTGIDPMTFTKNQVKANKELKDQGRYYYDLLEGGVLGTDLTIGDLAPVLDPGNPNATLGKAQNKIKSAIGSTVLGKGLQKFDDFASGLYSKTDDLSKMSAYISLREDYGYSKEEALQRVYEGFQNYATVGKAFDMAAKTPVVGNPYIKFKGDLARIIK
jgi:hypothetical protein